MWFFQETIQIINKIASMTSDLTINSIDFSKSFDEKDRSVRQSNARGINTPDIMTIQSQEYTDSVTKVKGIRYLMRFDRKAHDSVTGQPYTTSGYVVWQVPSLASGTDASAVVATLKAAVSTDAIVAQILNNEK